MSVSMFATTNQVAVIEAQETETEYAEIVFEEPVAAGTVRLSFPVNGLNFYCFGFKANSTSTAVEQIQGNNVQSTKVIRDGQILIIRDGKTYNALGAEMR